MTAGITIAAFPRTDRAFAAFVAQCWRETGNSGDPSALEGALRRWHTRASVHPRSELGSLGGGTTWYVYRDGYAGVRLEEGWWNEPDVGHVVFDADGMFLEANEAAEQLVGRGPGGLKGAHWSELVPLEARSESGEWLWSTLDSAGRLDSVFDLPLDNGQRRVIEYHSVPTTEPGVYEGFWRELTIIPTDEARGNAPAG